MNGRDRNLGMNRSISRRDFLNGILVGAGALAAAGQLEAAARAAGPGPGPESYPPALTGLRGSHEGSYEAAHALRDGTLWSRGGSPRDTGENYDLVVVGAGLSGLSAARFFRRRTGPQARILILDNHDDFGGHAKRNEFRRGAGMRMAFGGTWSIDSPAPYSRVARDLIRDLGIDVARFEAVHDADLYRSLGLGPALFFDRETFGSDRLLPDPTAGNSTTARDRWKEFETAPLSPAVRRDIRGIFGTNIDFLPGLTDAEKKSRLARTSYSRFLTEVARLDSGVLPFFQARTHSLYGVGIDAVSAQDAWGLGLPGFDGMNLDPSPGPGMGRDAIPNAEAEHYFFHFPDGNASVARLLVRDLIPAAIPGSTADDIVTAAVDYGRLDAPGSAARIRLDSTAVRVRHAGKAGSSNVEVVYARGGKLETVHAKNCILACWHAVIPHLCPELPEAQKAALHSAAKVPLLYTNVLIRNWTSFRKLGVSGIHAPGSYHTSAGLDMPVSIGSYGCSRLPDEAIVVNMERTPCRPGLSARDQHRVGRLELLTTTFDDIERNLRDQLARMLGAGGFDPARDIEAITANRWPHGYAYQYNSLWDAFWREGKTEDQPCLRARRRHGRIAIANADAAAYAYTDAAIDEAWRAVAELTG